MKSLKQITFKVPSSLQSLEVVLSVLEQCHDDGIFPRDWWQCRLLLAEGFTNTVRHAHQNLSDDTEIELELALFPQHLTMRIWDQGPPFDLSNHLQREQPPSQELLSGGWGLTIMAQLSADLSYYRSDDDRNCLMMVKEFSIPLTETLSEN